MHGLLTKQIFAQSIAEPALDDLLPDLSGQGYLSALYTGVLWTVFVFVALALYVNLRKVLRPRLRSFLRRVISDLRRP